MALTFPQNPTNGQIYGQYIFDSTSGTWKIYDNEYGLINVLATKANLNGGNTFSGNQTISGGIDATSFKNNNVSIVPRFLQIVNSGALATDHSFTISERSTCLFFFSPTGYIIAGAGPIATWTLLINGGSVATTRQYFNEASSHRAGPVGMGQTTLNAGTHTARVNIDRSYDTNDYATIWAILVPAA